MALFNEILVGRYNRALQKLTGIKGTVPSPQLASEIIPVIPFQTGIEGDYLQSWENFASDISTAASIGNNSAIRFRNPVGSNIVAVIKKIVVISTLADNVLLLNVGHNLDTDLSGGGFVGTQLDVRTRATSLCRLSQQNNLSSLINVMVFVVQGTVDREIINTNNQELILMPGTMYQFVTTTLNTILRATFLWKERYLEESERT